MEWTRSENIPLGLDANYFFEKPVDPYLIWAALTNFSGARAGPTIGMSRVGADSVVSVALEMHPYSGGMPPDLDDTVSDFNEIASIGNLVYATASVRISGLANLIQHQYVKRLELGFVRSTEPANQSETPNLVPTPAATHVIGVIDFGCAFAHERFRHVSKAQGSTGWETRIAYLWDQGRNPVNAVAGWRPPRGQAYGRELTANDINQLIVDHTAGGRIDEDALYRAVDYYDSVATPLAHGTHVLDLAAGVDFANEDGKQPAIIFVQLPNYAVNDTSGGSMVTHVMDALKYIVERTGPKMGLVVNLSYGSMAGPHDGSTILELAMDAVIDSSPERDKAAQPPRMRSIVLPAGNNYESDCHAHMKLKAGEMQTLLWEVRSGDPTDTFLEIWYPQPKNSGNRIRISVAPPNGPSQEVPLDEIWMLGGDSDKGPTCAVIHRNHVASGNNAAMALIALAPTQVKGGDRMAAAPGIWKITVSRDQGGDKDAIEIDAWIERDDPPIGSGAPPRQSRFLTGGPPLAVNEDSPVGSVVQREMTGNSIANGKNTVVVGAYIAHPNREGQIEMSRYSSSGYLSLARKKNISRTEPWPSYVAIGDDSRSLSGVLAAGTRSGVRVRMNGTSVAAPQAARVLMGTFFPGTRSVPPGTSSVRKIADESSAKKRKMK